MDKEVAKGWKVRKFIYAGLFDDEGSMLLCADGNDLRMPGGKVYLADICQFINEKWISDFLSRKIETDTGISSSLTKKRIQFFPAIYNTYFDNFKEEHSAIIVGKVNLEQITKDNVSFVDVQDILTKKIDEKIKKPQKVLILRMFASRDCPNSYNRKIAGKWLQSHT